MGNVFFTSDEHHGHRNIIDFCNRPFSSLEEQTEKIVSNHNEVVKAGDRVYHLGDMFWRTFAISSALQTVKRLNGQHYYIFGNHDELFRHKSLQECFIWCRETENFKAQGYSNIWLAHYAHRVWNGSHRGAYHLYGHTHAALPEDGSLSFDVGVDAQNFYPISLEDVDKRMKTKKGQFAGKQWVCDCGHSFLATSTVQATCAKCVKEMRLV